jgi:hypothetical protein
MLRRALFGLLALPLSANAQKVESLDPQSTDRRAVAELLDSVFRNATYGPVQLRVRSMRRSGDLAYARVRARRPGGRPILWENTDFRGRVTTADADCHVLLGWRDGGWQVLEVVAGAPQAPGVDWRERFGLPEGLV